jgi:hypothetical protein
MDRRILTRAIVINLGVYAILLVGYFFLVLRGLNQVLAHIYETNLPLYAAATLGLIVGQGLLLQIVTSFLVERLGIGDNRRE